MLKNFSLLYLFLWLQAPGAEKDPERKKKKKAGQVAELTDKVAELTVGESEPQAEAQEQSPVTAAVGPGAALPEVTRGVPAAARSKKQSGSS